MYVYLLIFLGALSRRSDPSTALRRPVNGSHLVCCRFQRSSGPGIDRQSAPSVGRHGPARRIEQWQPIKTSNCTKRSPGVVQGEQESGGWARQHHSGPTSRGSRWRTALRGWLASINLAQSIVPSTIGPSVGQSFDVVVQMLSLFSLGKYRQRDEWAVAIFN